MPAFLHDRLFSETREWLIETLWDEDIECIVPKGDPIRLWWDSTAEDRTAALLNIISGAGDTLTWLALVDAACGRGTVPSRTKDLFTKTLSVCAQSGRMTNFPKAFHAFLSYSHRDMDRAIALVDLLAKEGVHVFQDVRDIPAGESILGALHAAMTRACRAILLVSRNYSHSPWTDRELSVLKNRQSQGDLHIFPVLLDDVPLPALIEDTFTIDLRGFRGSEDNEWAKERLAKLAEAFRRR